MRPLALPVLSALAATLLLGAKAGGAEDTPRVETYEVYGSTFNELLASLAANGPLVERTGQRHFGVTEIGFRPSWTFKPLANGCQIVQAKVGIELTITLPRWGDRATADPDLRRRWDELRSDIVAHENAHAEIALDYLERMRAALNRPTRASNCDTLHATLTGRAQDLVERHRNAQRAFDGLPPQ